MGIFRIGYRFLTSSTLRSCTFRFSKFFRHLAKFFGKIEMLCCIGHWISNEEISNDLIQFSKT